MIGYGTKLLAFKDMGIRKTEIRLKFDQLNKFYLNNSFQVNDVCSDYINKWGLEDV